MTNEGLQRRYSEVELIRLVAQFLPKMFPESAIKEQYALSGRSRPDFIVFRREQPDVIVEVKGVAPSTQSRIRATADQIGRYVDDYRKSYPDKPDPQRVLIFPGIITPENQQILSDNFRTTFIDALGLHYQLTSLGVELDETLVMGDPADHPRLNPTTGKLENPDDDPTEPVAAHEATDTDNNCTQDRTESELSPQGEQEGLSRLLLERLEDIVPGRSDWVAYQRTCRDILAFLLTPPLAEPLTENSNESRINRRDLIFPNYVTDGFWQYIRTTYYAHFIVIDAKNYTGKVKKKDVLQLANYLSVHGTGLFGILVTRDTSDRGAEVTRREQWFMHGKLIIVLNDADLRQMIAMKNAGDDPVVHIRQKIEDFRLAF